MEGHVPVCWQSRSFSLYPCHPAGPAVICAEKWFKKRAGFLRNASQKQFGLRIARYLNRFAVVSFSLVLFAIGPHFPLQLAGCGMKWFYDFSVSQAWLSLLHHLWHWRYKKKSPWESNDFKDFGGCPVGFEPTTFRTTIWRSNQLNYGHHVGFGIAKIRKIFFRAIVWDNFSW